MKYTTEVDENFNMKQMIRDFYTFLGFEEEGSEKDLNQVVDEFYEKLYRVKGPTGLNDGIVDDLINEILWIGVYLGTLENKPLFFKETEEEEEGEEEAENEDDYNAMFQ